jgi:hypothetical protein
MPKLTSAVRVVERPTGIEALINGDELHEVRAKDRSQHTEQEHG